jgi:hypothetical protein
MLSRALLAGAVDVVCASRGDLGPQQLQRRLRVGLATAMQLGEALEDAGVLGANTGRRPVLVDDVDRATALVADGIAAGRIKLDTDDEETRP